MKHGTTYENGICLFRVWAPLKDEMTLHILSPQDLRMPMVKGEDGFFSLLLTDVSPDTTYFFSPDGTHDLPDPASQYQPGGVFGPSAVIDHDAYLWRDNDWHGTPRQQMILYELHIGCFTPEGTFDAAVFRLDDLIATGINTISLMPVNQFPGERNWGYDGVFPYAVQNSYGGPEGLKRFVEACHARGIAVLLDVVYNHLGPEGNVFAQFGPYFTDRYQTPWGQAINFDDSYADEVRSFFIGNMLYWLEHYHLDGLRVDAIHAIYDNSATHFWEEAYECVNELEQRVGHRFFIVAESDLNDPDVVKHPETGGYGFDAQWLDDFHHALYVLLDPAGKERYADFGKTEQVAKAFKEGFVHSGEYVHFRKRRHGRSSAGIPGERFVAFNQNHDQVGNRAQGERLSLLVDFEMLKTAAAALLMAPYIPLLFMGEEYAAEQPFLYFIHHSDEKLVRAVQEGRKKEFARYCWENEPPDPQSPGTFTRSKLQWEERTHSKHYIMLQWYRQLIAFRREHPALQCFDKDCVDAYVVAEKALVLHRTDKSRDAHVLCLFNFSGVPVWFCIPGYAGSWRKTADSAALQWPAHHVQAEGLPQVLPAGAGLQIAPHSVAIYVAVKPGAPDEI